MKDAPADALKEASPGSKLSLGAVMPLVYDELHRLATVYVRRELYFGFWLCANSAW